MIYDLEVLLDEVIKEYGENKGYKKPNIRWSKFNRLYSFGEYRYWNNIIEISSFLDNRKIGKDTLKSVIYHEYLHQLYKEHDNNFRKREALFPDVRKHQTILDRFFDEIEEIPVMEVRMTLDNSDNLVFCVLNGVELEEYLLSIYACNGNYYINLGNDIKLPFTTPEKKHDVIWLVKGDETYYVVGMAKDVKFFKETKIASLNPICSDKFSYQAISNIEKTSLFMDIGCDIPYNLWPKEINSGICYLNDILDFSFEDVIDYVNSYDCDLYNIGFSKTALYDITPLIEEDYKQLIELAYQEGDSMRAIWIANKGKVQNDCFETRLCLAECLLNGLLFDAALKEYIYLQKQYPGHENINERIGEIISILKRIE